MATYCFNLAAILAVSVILAAIEHDTTPVHKPKRGFGGAVVRELSFHLWGYGSNGPFPN